MLLRAPQTLRCFPPLPFLSSSSSSSSNIFPKPNPNNLRLLLRLSSSSSSSSSPPTMSSNRTVNDVLMGHARAAAEKKAKRNIPSKSQPSPPPSKKPKTLETQVTNGTIQSPTSPDEKVTAVEKKAKKNSPSQSQPPLAHCPPSPSKKPKTRETQATNDTKQSPTSPPPPQSDDNVTAVEKKAKKNPPSPSKKPKTLETQETNGTKQSPPRSPPPEPDEKVTAVEKKAKKKSPSKGSPPHSKKPKTLGTQETNVTKQSPPPPPLQQDEKVTAVELRKKGADFDPRAVASWKDGEPVPFLFLARALDLIANESGRIAITDILCNVFRTVIATTPNDLLSVVYLSANRIAPPHEGVELGIGDTSLIKALSEAYGRREDHVRKQLKELGDLGLVAKSSRLSQKMMFNFKPPPLTVAKVLDTFRTIAKESGKDSQDKKRSHIKGLLVAATDCEPQYIVRLLQSKMRIGLAEKTVLVALGQAAVYSDTLPVPPSHIQSPLEEAAKIIKHVYSVLPIYDKIVPALLRVGVCKLSEACDFSLGVPVGPMLAKPTKAVSEILDKFQGMEFTCEYKYDGERAQIHYMEDGSVEIYSRNAERNTGKYPDVVNSILRFKKPSVKSFVLDCEIVAYDRVKQKILPFQILSTRARKGVILSDIKVEVCTFAFDILYINGQPLLKEQLKVRREKLYSSFEEVTGVFQFATAIISNDLEEIQKFLESAVNSSSEGLIIKTLDRDATYEPSKRSNNWLKLKKDYMDSLGDSLDLVPIAAFHGRGKRTGVYGSFLLACYDDRNEEYQTICNMGSGFSEVELEERSKSLGNKVIPKPKPYYRYADSVSPDVWFEPSEVWEVKAADLSISPVHRAASGVVDPNKGISLRFPRLQRIRVDKAPDQATTSEQVAEMYRAQKINHANNQEEDDEE